MKYRLTVFEKVGLLVSILPSDATEEDFIREAVKLGLSLGDVEKYLKKREEENGDE